MASLVKYEFSEIIPTGGAKIDWTPRISRPISRQQHQEEWRAIIKAEFRAKIAEVLQRYDLPVDNGGDAIELPLR